MNKTDALGLVSNFGTVRTSINAQPEEIALIAGWGEKKVQRWCKAVREPFRSERASRKVLSLDSVGSQDGAVPVLGRDVSTASVPLRRAASSIQAEEEPLFVQNDAPIRSEPTVSKATGTTSTATARKRPAEDEVDDGVMAALAKLRK